MEEKKSKERIKKIIFFFPIPALVLIFFVFLSGCFFAVRVDSPAMMPEFVPGNIYWFTTHIRNLQRGDVVYYKHNDSSFAISRIIAFSGDTLRIVNGEVISPHINKKFNVYMDYFIHKPKKINIKNWLHILKISFSETFPDSIYIINTCEKKIGLLMQKIRALAVVKRCMKEKQPDREISASLRKLKYNRDQIPEYVVPYDTSNGGKKILYFLMNDNRPHALDSRFSGEVSLDKIIGKYVYE